MAPRWALRGEIDHLLKSRENYMSPLKLQECSGWEGKRRESRRPFSCFPRVGFLL